MLPEIATTPLPLSFLDNCDRQSRLKQLMLEERQKRKIKLQPKQLPNITIPYDVQEPKYESIQQNQYGTNGNDEQQTENKKKKNNFNNKPTRTAVKHSNTTVQQVKDSTDSDTEELCNCVYNDDEEFGCGEDCLNR